VLEFSCESQVDLKVFWNVETCELSQVVLKAFSTFPRDVASETDNDAVFNLVGYFAKFKIT